MFVTLTLLAVAYVLAALKVKLEDTGWEAMLRLSARRETLENAAIFVDFYTELQSIQWETQLVYVWLGESEEL